MGDTTKAAGKAETSAEGERRHQPKQSRSIETKRTILEAAAALFAEQGYEQTTTHQVAKAAHVSVGALYRYFADKQAIVEELYLQEVSALRTRLLREFSVVELVGQDFQQLVRKTMALTFKVYASRPGLRRVLSEQSRKVPQLVTLRRRQEAEIHKAVLQILSAAPGVHLPDREVGAYMIRLFLESLIEDHVLYQRGEFEEERLINAATDFILRYILGQVGP